MVGEDEAHELGSLRCAPTSLDNVETGPIDHRNELLIV